MKHRDITVTVFDIVFKDRTTAMLSLTKMELASFKRSNRYKEVLTMKKIAQIEIKIKSLHK
jgi:hypothetical protein